MEKTLAANLLGLIRENKLKYLKAAFLVILSNLLLIVNPFIFRKAANSISLSQDNSLFGDPFFLITILLLASAFSAFFKYLMRIQFVALSREAEEQFRDKLYERLQKQSKSFFDQHPVGELLSRISNDISTYREILGPGIMYPLFAFSMSIPAFVGLFILFPPLALFSLIPLGTLLLIHSFARKAIYSLSKKLQELLSELSVLAEETFSGIRILKTYDFKKIALKKFASRSKKHSFLRRKMFMIQGALLPFFIALVQASSAMTIYLFSLKGSFSIQDFLTFIWLQTYLFMPVMMLGWILSLYEQGKSAYDRLLELYSEPIEVKDEGQKDMVKGSLDIELKNLTFTYPASKTPSLKNVSLKIAEGETIGITGPIGSGKSTLLKLLQREYEIPKGMIYFARQEIHEYTLNALYSLMATCEQIPFLFSDTVQENIRFGRESASTLEIQDAAHFVDLHDEIEGFPEKYDTMIGEKGLMVSTGQKQRIAVARSLIASKKILLLDDIFANVDASKENKMVSRLIQDFKESTIIIVTNRMSVLDQLDKVCVFQEGRVVEQGDPTKLKKAGGPYQILYEIDQHS